MPSQGMYSIIVVGGSWNKKAFVLYAHGNIRPTMRRREDKTKSLQKK
jgi:hypothetical protein